MNFLSLQATVENTEDDTELTPSQWQEMVIGGCTTDATRATVTGDEDFEDVSLFLNVQYVDDTDDAPEIIAPPVLGNSERLIRGGKVSLSNLAWSPPGPAVEMK